jgi:hypothetical protein
MRDVFWFGFVAILLILIARVLSIFLPPETHWGVSLLLTFIVLAFLSPFLLKLAKENESFIVTDSFFGQTRTINGPKVARIFFWEDVAKDGGNTFVREDTLSDFSDEITSADDLRIRGDAFFSWVVEKSGVNQFNSKGADAKKIVEKKLRGFFQNYFLAVCQKSGKLMDGKDILLSRGDIISGFMAYMSTHAAFLLSEYGIRVTDCGIIEIDYATSSLEDLRNRGAQKLAADADLYLIKGVTALVKETLEKPTTAELTRATEAYLAAAGSSPGLTKEIKAFQLEGDPGLTAAVAELMANNPALASRIFPQKPTKGNKS